MLTEAEMQRIVLTLGRELAARLLGTRFVLVLMQDHDEYDCVAWSSTVPANELADSFSELAEIMRQRATATGVQAVKH